MAADATRRELLELLSQTFSIDQVSGGPPTHYNHVTAPPVPGGAVDVPELVVELLTVTDGAALFSSDDEELEAIGAPSYMALLYDRNEIEYWTNDLREQLLDQLQSWHADGDLSEERTTALARQVSQFWVIGATVNGDSFVVESPTATSIRIWPHETLLAPFFDAANAPRVEGIDGLVAWLEARLR